MLAKSLLAGVVMSVLAGGVVYFGLGGELSDQVNNERVSETVDTLEQKAKTGAQIASEKAKDVADSSRDKLNALIGKEPKVSFQTDTQDVDKAVKTNTDKTKPKTPAGTVTGEAEAEKTDPPKKRWLDEYLKSDKPKAAEGEAKDDKPDADDIKTENAQEAGEAKDKDKYDLRNYIKREQEKMRTTIETLDDVPEAKPKTDIGKDPDATERTSQKTVTLIKPEATASYKVKTLDEAMTKPSPPQMGHRELFNLLIREADKLDIPDMRDQAYLNIVDFALAKGDRNIADETLAKLSREELRDTARGRVAVALARSGQSEAAFDVIDTLEIEELQGPIRLQVIEALTLGKIPAK